MLECVPNVSEGRDRMALRALSDVCGGSLLDAHHDVDHHRSVLTLAGPAPRDAEAAVRALARAVAAHVDVSAHVGVHPRIGALDVVPFVALDGTDPTVAVEAAHSFGRWAADELATPIFFYGEADPRGRSLPTLRRDAFGSRSPDLGPDGPDLRLGAIAVGARPVLVAVNCELDRDDLILARAIASKVRERDGGLPGVRALGLALGSRARSQVSMNLVDLTSTGVEEACTTVREHARAARADVASVELVGLLPAAELARCSAEFVAWSGITDDQTIEARLARARHGSGVENQ